MTNEKLEKFIKFKLCASISPANMAKLIRINNSALPKYEKLQFLAVGIYMSLRFLMTSDEAAGDIFNIYNLLYQYAEEGKEDESNSEEG